MEKRINTGTLINHPSNIDNVPINSNKRIVSVLGVALLTYLASISPSSSANNQPLQQRSPKFCNQNIFLTK